MAGSVAMCLLSQSRAGWAIFLMLMPLLFLLGKFKNPLGLVFIGIAMCCLFLVSEVIYDIVNTAYMDVKAARPESSRVRSALAKIALERWESEAPIWGHGIVERGPKIVEFMPIGTHHSWYGLLFVKGAVGMLALAIPMFITSLYLLCQSQKTPIFGSAFCMILVFICYSFFENLEILAYIYWPALLWIGMALNPLKAGEKYV
ncbi:MAG: O-antigen ligase family protein [Oceanospirillaceae bacterium]